MGGRKLTTLTHKQKRELCRHKEKHPLLTNKDLQAWVLEKFGAKVHEATICRILKKSFSLLSNVTSNDVKRSKVPNCPAVEEALYKWFLAAQEGKMMISDVIFADKAKSLHSYLVSKNNTVKDCKFSSGWVAGFKKRHNIRLRVLHGEADSVQLTDETWDQIAALKVTLSSYEPCDVFNLDETGLFYTLEPNRALRDLAVKDQKVNRNRITVGLCANADASVRLPPLVINKVKNPWAFTQRRIKRPNNLGITWYANRWAWMKGDVFQDWLLKFESHMQELGKKKVALLVDNAPGHLLGSIPEQLQITKVLFLPANTTSRFQPMDAGVISSFKTHYRRLFVRRQLETFERQDPFELDIYDAIQMLVHAWVEGVTPDTIRNCWEHVGLIPHKDERPNLPREPDLETPLQDPDSKAQMEELGEYLGQLALQVLANLTAEEYVDVDCVQNAPTFPLDADLSDFLVDDCVGVEEGEAMEMDGENKEGQIIEAETVPQIPYGQGMAHFEELKVFLQQQEYDTTNMILELTKMMKVCTQEHIKPLVVQNTLVEFFELDGRPVDHELEGRPLLHELEGRPLIHELEGRPVEHELEGRPMDHEMEGRGVDHELEGRAVDHEIEGRAVDHEIEGRAVDHEIEGRAVQQEIEGSDLHHEFDGRTVKLEIEGRAVEHEIEGRDVHHELEGRDVGLELEGRDVDLELEGRAVEHELEGRDVDLELEGRAVEHELEGRDVDLELGGRAVDQELGS